MVDKKRTFTICCCYLLMEKDAINVKKKTIHIQSRGFGEITKLGFRNEMRILEK
jgi:hypothetical protein